MATLTYRHFGNPGRCLSQAHYKILHKKVGLELFFDLLMYKTYRNALERQFKWPQAAAAGGRALAAAGFFILCM